LGADSTAPYLSSTAVHGYREGTDLGRGPITEKGTMEPNHGIKSY